MHIQPLTHHNNAGELYQRPNIITAQIQNVIELPPYLLFPRARISDSESPDFLKEECLVYLIREYHRRREEALVNDLAEILIRRSTGIIQSKLVSLTADAKQDAHSDVIAKLFDLILDMENDRGDFLQVRYWVVIERLTIDVFRRHCRTLSQKKNTISISPSVFSNSHDDQMQARNLVSGETLADTQLSVEELMLLQDGLNILDEQHKVAFILRHYASWPIESHDPLEPTISQYFDKTPRTIRNWLTQVEKQLERWRQNEQP